MTEQSYRLTFTDGHRSEHDRTLGELMENARRVIDTQGRLRELLRASQAVAEQLLEDRGRIAQDLHDHVIQRLFATGLSLQAASTTIPDARTRQRIADQVQSLDEAIIAIRTAISTLTAESDERPPLRQRVIDLLTQLGDLFENPPLLVVTGTIDRPVADDLADDVLAVLREGLTNVARHAQAREVRVALTIDGHALTLEIADDGVGVGDSGRRSGIANLERRAARHGGSARVERPRHGGTLVTWHARLRPATEEVEMTGDPGIPAR